MALYDRIVNISHIAYRHIHIYSVDAYSYTIPCIVSRCKPHVDIQPARGFRMRMRASLHIYAATIRQTHFVRRRLYTKPRVFSSMDILLTLAHGMHRGSLRTRSRSIGMFRGRLGDAIPQTPPNRFVEDDVAMVRWCLELIVLVYVCLPSICRCDVIYTFFFIIYIHSELFV